MATSCNQSKTKEEKTDNNQQKEEFHTYLYQNDRDTVKLNIQKRGKQVSGTLFYSYFEKDANKGTITGEMINDLLVADYKFESEGLISIRQVVFKETSGGMIEGYGPIEERNGRIVLKNLDSLNFTNSLLLKKIN